MHIYIFLCNIAESPYGLNAHRKDAMVSGYFSETCKAFHQKSITLGKSNISYLQHLKMAAVRYEALYKKKQAISIVLMYAGLHHS